MLPRMCFIAMIAIVVFCERTCAQGTQREFADPITLNDLERWGVDLRLSDAQRSALAALHEGYARDFQTLRDGAIEQYFKDSTTGYVQRARVAKRQELRQRIATLDASLFDRLAESLTDEQLAGLPRTRAARERVRITSVFGFFLSPFERPVPEIGALASGLILDAQQREAIDAILIPYESNLTSLLRRIDDASDRAMAAMADAITNAGFTDDQRRDPAFGEAIRAVIAPVGRERETEIGRIYGDVCALQRRTERSIEQLLPPVEARTFRLAFFAAMYSEIGIPGYERSMASNLQDKRKQATLSEETESSIAQAIAKFRAETDPLMEESADLIDGFRQSSVRYATRDEQAARWKDHQGALSDVGGRIMKHLDAVHRVMRSGPKPATAEAESADLRRSDIRREFIAAPSDLFWAYLAQPMSPGEIKAIRDALRLDDKAAATMDQLVAQYQEAISGFMQRERNEIHTARQGRWPLEKDEQPITQDVADRIISSQRDAIRVLHAADTALLDAAALAADATAAAAFARLRLARERAWYACGMHGGWLRETQPGPGNRNDCNIDLSWLARRLSFIDAASPAIDSILAEYEIALTPLMRSKFEANVEYLALEQQADVDSKAGKIQDRMMLARERLAEIAAVPGVRSAQANAAISELNAQTAQRIAEALEPESADRWLRLYNRLALPQVYNDPASAESAIRAGIARQDLSHDQRTRLEQVAAEYFPAYHDLTQRMVASIETIESPYYRWTRDVRLFEEAQVRGRERVRMAFDRHQLNVSALRRMREILTPEQIEAIGGLPDPPEFWQGDFGR